MYFNLQHCNFDIALFCPTQIYAKVDQHSDQANLNHDKNEQLKRCEENRRVWLHLLNNNKTCSITQVNQCIEDVINWLNVYSTKRASDSVLHVLVTGSLHLVGGVLSIIDQ
jgi:hypothetical protein